MPLRNVRFSLVLLFLLVSSSLIAQKPRDAARWVDGLKNTSASELGSGLPHEKFAVWFADLVTPNKVVYGVEECDLYNPADGVTERVFCVVAYTKPPHPGWERWIRLSFVVGSIPSREEEAKAPGTKWSPTYFTGVSRAQSIRRRLVQTVCSPS